MLRDRLNLTPKAPPKATATAPAPKAPGRTGPAPDKTPAKAPGVPQRPR
jgi:hypothetical protein